MVTSSFSIFSDLNYGLLKFKLLFFLPVIAEIGNTSGFYIKHILEIGANTTDIPYLLISSTRYL